eukprot:m.353351 g.353351  ORF g.353351 m.353351 type:complete len:145 (+) comp16592_c0_seq14:242-676(+)
MAGVFETSGMPDTVDNADWLRFDRLTINHRGRVLGDDRLTACETWEDTFTLPDEQELYSAYDKLKELGQTRVSHFDDSTNVINVGLQDDSVQACKVEYISLAGGLVSAVPATEAVKFEDGWDLHESAAKKAKELPTADLQPFTC